MSSLSPLGQHAYDAARYGTYDDAREVLYAYAYECGWVAETCRARWDGASALLEWWRSLDPSARPPLDRFHKSDAQAFICYLEAKQLARSTIKSYRTGARAFIRATAWALGNLEQPSYRDPFEFATPVPKGRQLPEVSEAKLEAIENARMQKRLRVLLTLMNLGMGLPEVCTLSWGDVSYNGRHVIGYRKRVVYLNTRALEALEELWAVLPRGLKSRDRRVLCWQPGTARSWLKKVVATRASKKSACLAAREPTRADYEIANLERSCSNTPVLQKGHG